jgi:hypothetical protein
VKDVLEDGICLMKDLERRERQRAERKHQYRQIVVKTYPTGSFDVVRVPLSALEDAR